MSLLEAIVLVGGATAILAIVMSAIAQPLGPFEGDE